MRRTMAAIAMLAFAGPAAAQHAGHGTGGGLPDGWHGRVDRESQQLADVRFMTMGSTFHVITGPHVILWKPEHSGTGAYTASATFRQAKAPERPEGFGLFVGGQDLGGAGQDYLYFLIRHDGSYMIRHRAGSEVHTLADWTAHDAVRRPTASEGASNTVAIDAGATRVRFLVNDVEVRAFDRVPMLNTDGIAGFRIGHHLDVHIADFVVSPAQ
ncbi:MAG: hypothetical protein KFH98_09845 [Gemmatimonadetes bacterium]|nr:hypothetical protein [Gemmatimonadota bacterium]